MQYSILLVIVTFALVAMNAYLRRGIQARVKDLTDAVICERQLASLNDPVTEKFVKSIESTHNLQKSEGLGGISSSNSVSAHTMDLEHEVEDLEGVDYGQGVPDIINPLAVYMHYGSDGGGQ